MILIINTGIIFDSVMDKRGCILYYNLLRDVANHAKRNDKIISFCSDLGFENILVVTNFVDHALLLRNLNPEINAYSLNRIPMDKNYIKVIFVGIISPIENLKLINISQCKLIICLSDNNRVLGRVIKSNLNTYSVIDNIKFFRTNSWEIPVLDDDV